MKAAIACPQGIKSAKVDPYCFRAVSDKTHGLLSMDKDRIENQTPPEGHKSEQRSNLYSQLMYTIQSSKTQRRCGCGLGILSPSLTYMY